MEGGERENSFIKNHISQYIYSPFLWIKAFKTFVGIAIANEHALLGAKLKFS